jgi:uncharacterized protein
MLGSYEIEYKGRRYFGNVTLREHHIFDYDSSSYLADVGSMATYPISRRLAGLIGRVVSSFGGLIPEPVILEMRKFKLIAEEEEAPREPRAADESSRVTGRGEYPIINISLFLSQECNMHCIYCYGVGGEYAQRGRMSEEMAFRAVDWLIANSGSAERVNICFFGGEPLLNFSVMKQTVSYAREKAAEQSKKITFWITTNGSLLSEEILSFLKEEDISPMISFDGLPEYQNRQRPFKDGRGSYDTIYANLLKLRTFLPHLTGRATIWRDADPSLVKDGMIKAGFSTCYIAKASPVLLDAHQIDMPQDDGLGEQTLKRMMDFNRKEVEELFAVIRERKIDKDRLPPLLARLADICCGRKRHYSCGIGKGMVGISITGDIYPCHRFAGQDDIRMGNIDEYRAEGLTDYHRAGVDQLPVCRSCWARYYCGGGCLYRNKALTGDMYRPDDLDCREEKALIKGLIHLYHQLDEDDREYLKNFVNEGMFQDQHP